MKTMVIYDSRYGNTEMIAHAIGAGLSSALGAAASVEAVDVGAAHPEQLAGLDLLAGSPTNGSRPSPPMHDFLNRIPEDTLNGVKVAAFDTRTDMDKLEGAAHFSARFSTTSAMLRHGLVQPREKRRAGG